MNIKFDKKFEDIVIELINNLNDNNYFKKLKKLKKNIN
jgi:hypothetical protein